MRPVHPEERSQRSPAGQDCRLFAGIVPSDELSLKMQIWTHLKALGEVGATPRQFAQDLMKKHLATGDARAVTERLQELLERMVGLPGYERTEKLAGGRYRAADLRNGIIQEQAGTRRARASRESDPGDGSVHPVVTRRAQEEIPVHTLHDEAGRDEPEVAPPARLRPRRASPTPIESHQEEIPARAASRPTAEGNAVFIAGSKGGKIVDQLTEILTFGRFDPIVSEGYDGASASTPGKLVRDMRSCSTAVIHVAADQILYDENDKRHPTLNDEALIQIGAAMALYGGNFILLVQEGVQLPSHLGGFYECRYEGEKLDGEATMQLLKAFNDLGRPPS